MLHEHAICYHNHLSTEQLDYIVRKANRLGMVSRDILGVHEETDEEGTHVYFDLNRRHFEEKGDRREVS